MARVLKERLDIIQKVLQDYFKVHQFNKEKQCKSFDANRMSMYLEKKLNKEQERHFEKHLFQCSYCLGIYNQIENEINLLFKAHLRKVGEPLMAQALKVLEEEHKKFMADKHLTRIIFKIKEKGIELIELLNCPKFVPVPLPALRGREENVLLKEIKIENRFDDMNYSLQIQYFNEKQFHLILKFPDPWVQKYKDGSLELQSQETRMTKTIDHEIRFDNLNHQDNYTIVLNKIVLIHLEVPS